MREILSQSALDLRKKTSDRFSFKQDLQNIKNNLLYGHKNNSLNCGMMLGNMNTGAYRGGGIDDTDLKTYWKFDEASGDIINQSQSGADLGAGADIQITGATYSATGKISNALSFDGINDFGVMGTSLSQFNFMHNTTAKFTLCFWMKKLAGGGGSRRTIMANSSGSGGNIGHYIIIETPASSFYRITIGLSNGTTTTELTNAGTGRIPEDTNWHFVVVKYDESLASANFVTQIDNGTAETVNKSGTRSNSNATAAANLCRVPSNIIFIDSIIDEMSLWNKTLSADELTALYNSGNGRAIY